MTNLRRTRIEGVLSIFTEKLRNPEDWPPLVNFCLQYIKESMMESITFNSEENMYAQAINLAIDTIPEEKFPKLHQEYERWISGMGLLVRPQKESPIMKEQIMQYFEYHHLPDHLRAVSEPFCELAQLIVGDPEPPEGTPVQFPLPRCAERTVALRKLLEAKDAAVRAALYKEPPPAPLAPHGVDPNFWVESPSLKKE